MARLVTFFTLLFLLMIQKSEMSPSPPLSSSSCQLVYWDFVTCIRYLAGYEPNPAGHCCKTVAELDKEPNKYSNENVCECIEKMSKVVDIPFDLARIESLPDKCRMPTTFHISNSINCTLTHYYGETYRRTGVEQKGQI